LNIFGKKFTGPFELDFEKLPNISAVYIIASKESEEFEPLYIGYASRLGARLKQHGVFGTILSHGFLSNDVSIYYWEFDSNSRAEAQILEATLIKEFKPKFNYESINHSKFQEQIQKLKEEEEVRSKQWFRSSILASITMIIGQY
jgi:excinuclease UvrABC nuclease subunit